MAKKVEIRFNSDGFRQILMGSGVQSVVQDATNNIKTKANANLDGNSEGYRSHVWQGNYGGGRWIGSVSSTDAESARAESEDKALSKAVK